MDRGKQGDSRSQLTEATGIPLALNIDGANRHNIKLVCNTFGQHHGSTPVANGDHAAKVVSRQGI